MALSVRRSAVSACRFAAVMMRALFLAVLLAPIAQVATAGCVARSGSAVRPLLELYRSEGCQGCRQAEARLLGLERPDVVALAFPLRLAERGSGEAGPPPAAARERRLTLAQRRALVVTPQVLLQGEAMHEWRTRTLERALEALSGTPVRAGLSLALVASAADGIEAEATMEAAPEGAVLYLTAIGATGGGLPEGRTWEGPFRGPTVRRRLPLPPGVHPADAGVAAFVRASGRPGAVLQALARGPCGIVPGSM